MDKFYNSFYKVVDKIYGWFDSLVYNIPNILVAIIVMAIFILLSIQVKKWVKKIATKRINQVSAVNLLSTISATIIISLGFFLSLGAMNLESTLKALLTGAGISGIVVGFALQGALSNWFSGIVLSFRKKMALGDWIQTNGFEGEIIEINLNYLMLKEIDNNMVLIPNKIILENPLKNFSLTSKHRVIVECGVGYESDLDAVEKLTKNALKEKFKLVDVNQVEFYYKEFGESSINFICRFLVNGKNSGPEIKATSDAIIAIKKTFDENNINIPFPIRTVINS